MIDVMKQAMFLPVYKFKKDSNIENYFVLF
jgi:hypothetical protein